MNYVGKRFIRIFCFLTVQLKCLSNAVIADFGPIASDCEV